MNEFDFAEIREWLNNQVALYTERYPNYVFLAENLQEVLKSAAGKLAPLAIVQTRPKGISNFADKCMRKRASVKDPVNEFTDLCGGRVIVHTAEQVEAVSAFIKNNFIIDTVNTVDVRERLKPTEFGYRSVHYIISYKKDVFPSEEVNVEVPGLLFDDKAFPNRRAEIQVRTILEHAWADIAHALVYKSPFPVPAKWEREFAGVAAMLEGIDKTFSRVKEGLGAYASSYGAYMSKMEMENQLKLLEIVMEHDPGNPRLAEKVARLAMILGDWEKAIDILSSHACSGDDQVLILLGKALCERYRNRPRGQKYKRGQRYLENVCFPQGENIDALACLADTYKGNDNQKARDLYHQAFQLDTSNPFPLENYLDLEISLSGDDSVITSLRPVINRAMQRCRDQVEVGVNMPEVLYTIGKFHLLLGEPYSALEAYAKALQVSPSPHMIENALNSLEHLKAIASQIEGYEWLHRLLNLALAANLRKKYEEVKQLLQNVNDGMEDVNEKEASDLNKALDEWSKKANAALARVKKLTMAKKQSLSPPVIILAGGCDSFVEEEMHAYQDMLITAFRDFKGTVVSGGSRQGISGLAGELGKVYEDNIKTVGYLPKLVPVTASKDERYHFVYETDGTDFTPLEPLQNWIDLIASGIDPATVKVLGINGGRIAAAEYRIALALGATVGLIADSGREVTRIMQDEDRFDSGKLIYLPADVMTVRAFVGTAGDRLVEKERKKVAQRIHDIYRKTRREQLLTAEPVMQDWQELPVDLMHSNLRQADNILDKLSEIGCTVHRPSDRNIELFEFSAEEIESLAEMEHGSWNVERLMKGWRWGPVKDADKKISPYLIKWDELPEDVKDWDRDAVRSIPGLLAAVGLEIRRQK